MQYTNFRSYTVPGAQQCCKKEYIESIFRAERKKRKSNHRHHSKDVHIYMLATTGKHQELKGGKMIKIHIYSYFNPLKK